MFWKNNIIKRKFQVLKRIHALSLCNIHGCVFLSHWQVLTVMKSFNYAEHLQMDIDHGFAHWLFISFWQLHCR